MRLPPAVAAVKAALLSPDPICLVGEERLPHVAAPPRCQARSSTLWFSPRRIAFLRSGCSIQPDVFPGDRIFHRLQVGEDGHPRHYGANVPLEHFEQIVSTLDRPITRDQDVQRDEAARPGLPRS
jgi:hypothetical protein